MTQRMHVATVLFPAGTDLSQIQRAYDDDFIMPDGSWRKITDDKVEISIVLDDLPVEQELEFLKEGLSIWLGDYTITSIGDEEDHRDLDPCFAVLA